VKHLGDAADRVRSGETAATPAHHRDVSAAGAVVARSQSRKLNAAAVQSASQQQQAAQQ
jgi:hypothetical protein